MPCRLGLLVIVLSVSIGNACTYCDPSNLKLQTLRQDARTSKFIVIGSLNNPRLIGEAGFTDISVDQVVKEDPLLGKQKVLTLPRWMPVDAKKPPRFMVFFDSYDGKLDPFRGMMLRGDGMYEYFRGALQLDDRDRTTCLLYYFKHLDSNDPDVASDAFLEFAKASDVEVGAVGSKLDPNRIRKLLGDPKMPAERLGLFAFLLGACGGKTDADYLLASLNKSDDRSSAALSGMLGGLIQMRPEEGWKKALELLDDPKRRYQDKLSVLATIRFFQAFRPMEHRKSIMVGMAAVVGHGDMADMAVEDLRRWKTWDLTKLVLSKYGKPTHGAPLVKHAIVRYAICCPDAEAAAFVKNLKATESELIREIEESLEFERTPTAKPKP